MPNAKNIIKANEKDNKVTVTLYGQEHDITKKVKNGVAHIKLYGQEYEVQVVAEKKKEAISSLSKHRLRNEGLNNG